MNYVVWLAGLSIVFLALERVWPRANQPIFRAGIFSDLLFLIFNGHFLGVLLARWSTPFIAGLDAGLENWGLREQFYVGAAADWAPWAQFLVALLAVDFLHWCIHNLLHRVSWLWELHKVHHSIEIMDWIGSMRFHWGEVAIYKSLTYPLLAFFGFEAQVLFVLAVVNTAIGHFNHSNLSWTIGPAKYVLNNPEMHIWHHTHPDAGPINRNFGITLSLWDWLFGTAYVPDTPPSRLAFPEIDSHPKTMLGQMLHPLPVERGIRQILGR